MTKTIIIVDEKPTLEQLQGMVGGYIEVVQFVASGHQFICNEEGKLLGKPPNVEATWMCKDEYPKHFTTDYLAGDVVVLKGEARLT